MQQRTAAALAWATFVLCAAMVSGAVWIGVLGGSSFASFGVYGTTAVLTFPLVGALIASRRSENPIGWIFCAIGVSFGVALLSTAWSDYAITTHPGALPLGPFMAWLGVWTWPPGLLLLFSFLLLLFPDGRLPSKRWRPVMWLSWFALALMVLPIAVTAWPIRGPVLMEIGDAAPAAAPSSFKLGFNLQVTGILMTFCIGLASTVALVLRLRRAYGDEREQLRWFAYAGAVLVAGVILGSPLFHAPRWVEVFAYPLIPVASAIAIFKYRLYDIDVVIRKTVVFGAIAAFITAVYMAVVVGPILLIGSGGTRTSIVLSAIAAALVAVAFQPIRARAQRLANRLVYGERATPYEVLSEFSERMGEAVATEDVLPRMARVLAEGAAASGAEVWLRTGHEMRREASWPANAGAQIIHLAGDDVPSFEDDRSVAPVRHRGELLGALTVTKPPDEPLTPEEHKLVEDLAAQAGLVLRNVGLISELRASRQRLVAAQDEERRRIERNLHDGAQQQLVALSVKQRLAASLIERDPKAAGQVLKDVQAETTDALETLRDLAHGIYPPLLADSGLAAALGSQARKATLPVQIEAELGGRHPPDLEAAVYFCCLEALQNVTKYACASKATIQLLDEERWLTFTVSDDGRGFDPEVSPRGSGLQGMADRLDALGGTLDVRSSPGRGTTVTGRVPT